MTCQRNIHVKVTFFLDVKISRLQNKWTQKLLLKRFTSDGRLVQGSSEMSVYVYVCRS